MMENIHSETYSHLIDKTCLTHSISKYAKTDGIFQKTIREREGIKSYVMGVSLNKLNEVVSRCLTRKLYIYTIISLLYIV